MFLDAPLLLKHPLWCEWSSWGCTHRHNSLQRGEKLLLPLDLLYGMVTVGREQIKPERLEPDACLSSPTANAEGYRAGPSQEGGCPHSSQAFPKTACEVLGCAGAVMSPLPPTSHTGAENRNSVLGLRLRKRLRSPVVLGLKSRALCF